MEACRPVLCHCPFFLVDDDFTITAGKESVLARPVLWEMKPWSERASTPTHTRSLSELVCPTICIATVKARALTSTTSKLLYTLLYDNSMLPDDAAREKDKASRTATFTRVLENMKTYAEGGEVPRGSGPGGRRNYRGHARTTLR